MPWKETCAMSERERFIRLYLGRDHTVTDLCRVFGVSRKTAYKWLERFAGGGIAGLADLSRAPKAHPNAVTADVKAALIAARRAHPRWGPRKLLAWIARREPERKWPAASTLGQLLRREGLVVKKQRSVRAACYTSSVGGYYGPNAIWCADFKGHFAMLGGRRCHPLTISDGFSRYLLRCQALARADVVMSWPVFEAAFCEYGLPEAIRTDNGAPFSAIGGLTPLAIWWVKLGIRPERITPGRPTENGRHERIHRTLIDELLSLSREGNLEAQQHAFDRFRQLYNEERPHEALSLKPPASVYGPSSRRYPTKLREPDYPSHYRVERVRLDGWLSCNGHSVPVSRHLVGEPVGMEHVEADAVRLHYGTIVLGTVDQKGRFTRGIPKRSRRSQTLSADSRVSPMSPV